MTYEEMARQFAQVPQDRLSGVFQELLGSKRQSQPSLRGLDTILGTGLQRQPLNHQSLILHLPVQRGEQVCNGVLW